MRYDMIEIEDNVIISYGVLFSCHGPSCSGHRIVIRKGAYIGMRSTIIAREEVTEIGEGAVIGACTLVNKSVPKEKTAVGIPCSILK